VQGNCSTRTGAPLYPELTILSRNSTVIPPNSSDFSAIRETFALFARCRPSWFLQESTLSLGVSGFANPSSTALWASKVVLPAEMSHGVSQQPIGFSLIAAAIGFKPCNDVRVKTHGNGRLLWPIELANFGSAPIKNWRDVGKINVLFSFCGDSSNVSLLFLCEFPHSLSFRATQRRGPR
jgi:hypothetical protein